MDARFKATFRPVELPFIIQGVDPDGLIWVKNLLPETLDTRVTENWEVTEFSIGTDLFSLLAYAQGTPFTKWGDLFG